MSGVRHPPCHLKQRSEFLRLARLGRRFVAPGFIVQALPRGDRGPSRMGITVTRRVGNAVVRNRTRRRLREAARLALSERARPGVDFVLIGRAATGKQKFCTLMRDFNRALDRIGAP